MPTPATAPALHPEMTRRARVIPPPLPGVLLLLLALTAYLPALRAQYVWDDRQYLLENQSLKSVGGLGRIWFNVRATPQYYPLVFTTFWIEHRLWGDKPAGYHLVNVLLHGLGALLLWRVLARLGVPGAWMVAAIFAVHPVHVESVAWITERKNVLSGVFYLAAMLAYLRYDAERPESPGGSWLNRRYAIAMLLFVLALLSKTVTCTLPVVLLLVLWWRRDRLTRADILPLLPMLLVGATFGALTAWVERHHVGAAGVEWHFSLVQRCLIASRAVWFYIGKLVWPANLTFIYPRWDIAGAPASHYLLLLTVPVLLAGLWAMRKRLGNAPLVAFATFIVTLSPALGFFDVYPMRYSFVADHFQYLASIPIIALIVGTLARATGHSPDRTAFTQSSLAAPAAIVGLGTVAGLTLLSSLHARTFHDDERVWRDVIDKNPSAFIAHNNLGVILRDRGEQREAFRLFTEAVRLNPDDGPSRNSLGSLLFDARDNEEAIVHLERAADLMPDDAVVRNMLGSAYLKLGRLREAETRFRDAIHLEPAYADAYSNLGVTLAMVNKTSESIDALQNAVRLNPNHREANMNLGNAYVDAGRLDDAVRHYQAGLKFTEEARVYAGVGATLLAHGRREEALRILRQGVELDPNDWEIRELVAQAVLTTAPASQPATTQAR